MKEGKVDQDLSLGDTLQYVVGWLIQSSANKALILVNYSIAMYFPLKKHYESTSSSHYWYLSIGSMLDHKVATAAPTIAKDTIPIAGIEADICPKCFFASTYASVGLLLKVSMTNVLRDDSSKPPC